MNDYLVPIKRCTLASAS